MTGSVFVLIPGLTEKHRAELLEAGKQNQVDIRIFDRAEDALAEIDHAEVIFSPNTALSAAAKNLRWQCTSSAGINMFMGEGIFCADHVTLTNSAGAYGVTISEHILMQTLELMRRQVEYNSITAQRLWKRDLKVRSIRGSRVTLLGTGDIGQEAAKRLRGFDPACVIGVNRSGKNPGDRFDRVLPQTELDSVLPETDLLIISLPGTSATYHMLDERRLSMLPDGAMVVNVGRGTVIDQKALEKQLRAGRLSAALDVFEQEPLPVDDTLWDCPNLLITPHSAGNLTLDYTLDRIVEMFLEDLANYCAGRPLAHEASLQAGY